MLRSALIHNTMAAGDGTTGVVPSICRGRISPVCSSVLLGLLAVPAIAAPASPATDSHSQPRLRLATVLESLYREPRSVSDAPSGGTETPDSESSTKDLPPLQLSWAPQLPVVPSPKPATPEPPPSSSLTRSPPEGARPARQPKPEDDSSGGEAPPIPVRRSTVVKSDAPVPASEMSDKRKNLAQPLKKTAASTNVAADDGSTTSSGAGGADATVVGEGDFLPADEFEAESEVADLPVPSRDKPSPSKTEAGATRKRWGMAPVRWGGTLSVGLRRQSNDDAQATTSQVYESHLRANSYLWKPYIALVSGDLTLTSVRSQESGDVSSSNLVGTSVSGSGSINLFPRSRFPFTASLSQSDSRSDGSFSSSNTQQRRLALRQDYRPQRGQWSAAGGYDRSELTGSFGSDVVDRIFGNFSNNADRHSINLAGDFSQNRSGSQSSKGYFLSGGHAFSYSDELSLSTNASFVAQQFDLGSQAAGSNVTTQSAQVFSYANWSPMDSKWRSSANIRYFQTNNSIQGTSFETRSMGGALNTSYQASRNLSFSGALGLNIDQDGGTTSTQTLGMSYGGDPLRIGSYDYSWSTSTSASNATSPTGESFHSIGAALGHSLMRNWQTSESTQLSGSLNQSVSTARSTGLGSSSTTTLSHGASASLSASANNSLRGYLSANVSDSRSVGDASSSFQMINVQLTGNWHIDRNSQLDSNLTWQWARQQSERKETVVVTDEFGRPLLRDDSSPTGNTSIFGGFGYSHNRFFGIRGLVYRLDFRANTHRDNARRFGDPSAPRQEDRITMDLDQRLLYRIGRLDTQLQFRIAEIEGRRNQLIYFRVGRDFGSF